MANINGTGNLQDELNRMNPASAHAKLGDLLAEVITKHNALVAKLDADVGVTDTTYTSLLAITPLKDR